MEEKEEKTATGRTSKSSSPHSAQVVDDLELSEEQAKKRRRNSCDCEIGETNFPSKECSGEKMNGVDDGTSNLTIKNVADHEKRCEEEEREKNRCKENEIGDNRSKKSEKIDKQKVAGAINLDEVVDNFSTMATDGSRHSLCGSCEEENQGKNRGLISDQNKKDFAKKDETTSSNEAASAETSFGVEIDFHRPNDCNAALDADGNVLDPGQLGEPNEPLLGQWGATKESFPSLGNTSRGADDHSGSRESSSDDLPALLANSPSGALFYEAASTTPTRDSMGVARRSFSNDHDGGDDDDDDEDSMVTSKSGEGVATGSSTALGDVNWPMPPHKWNAVKAWRNREFGYANGHSPDWFRYRANGSLHFVQRLELMYKMEAHDGCVNCLHFNSSGTRLASGSDDLNIVIWDWTTSRPLLTIESGHRANIFQAKFMPLSGDCHIVSCARDGQVRLAELSVRGICKNTRKLAQHRGSSHKLALQPDSPHTFLSCGDDAVVFELDLRDPKPNKLLVCKGRRPRGSHEEKVALYSIHSHPRKPHYFATSGRDPFCRLYDKRMIGDNAEPVKKFCPENLLNVEDGSKTNVTAVVFNYDGSELLGTYNDDDIYLFGTEQSNENEYKHRYKGHRNNATVKGVNFYGPQSEFIVSGSDCGYIYFWDKESETIVQFLPGDEGGVVNVLEPHPTCAMLATSGLDHDVKIWVPSCEDPKFNVNLLQKLLRRNVRERERDRRNDTGEIDSQMLYYIMSRFRRAARRSDRREGADESDDTDQSDNNDDEDGDGPVAMQCRPS